MVIIVDPKERARIMAIVYVMMILATSPFGWIAGQLSQLDRNLPFVLSIALYGLGGLLTLLSSRLPRPAAVYGELATRPTGRFAGQLPMSAAAPVRSLPVGQRMKNRRGGLEALAGFCRRPPNRLKPRDQSGGRFSGQLTPRRKERKGQGSSASHLSVVASLRETGAASFKAAHQSVRRPPHAADDPQAARRLRPGRGGCRRWPGAPAARGRSDRRDGRSAARPRCR